MAGAPKFSGRPLAASSLQWLVAAWRSGDEITRKMTRKSRNLGSRMAVHCARIIQPEKSGARVRAPPLCAAARVTRLARRCPRRAVPSQRALPHCGAAPARRVVPARARRFALVHQPPVLAEYRAHSGQSPPAGTWSRSAPTASTRTTAGSVRTAASRANLRPTVPGDLDAGTPARRNPSAPAPPLTCPPFGPCALPLPLQGRSARSGLRYRLPDRLVPPPSVLTDGHWAAPSGSHRCGRLLTFRCQR
jgi:hypothetical protein